MEKAPMPTEIRETSIASAGELDAVRIRIADAALNDPKLSFEIAILAHVSPRLMPTVAHVQLQAMKMTRKTLNDLIALLEEGITRAGYPPELPPRHPKS
jgi:hypothetical protein